jgi:phage terminase large subunit
MVPRAFAPLLGPSRYKGAYGGRGSGKSHFFAEKLIRKALATPEGLRWACVREIQKSLEQSAMRLLADKINKWDLGHLFDIRSNYILTPSDSAEPGMIIFQGMQSHNAHSIKSLEDYHGCWIEEAHGISAHSWSILRPTFRRDDSEIWASWNPTQRTDPVDVFFRSDDPYPSLACVEANWYDNPYFPANLDEERRYDKRRDPDRYNHVWMGKYLSLSHARVFRNWKIDDFDTPADARFYFGADWGYAEDPTVLVRCFIDDERRRLYVDWEAYQLRCEIDRIPDLFSLVPESSSWPIRADSARPDTISYVANRGYNVVPSTKGAHSVEDGIEFLQSYDIVVHPRCVHTADELSFYSWQVDKKTEEVLPRLEDKHNHVIDSLRYALEGARKGISMADFL